METAVSVSVCVCLCAFQSIPRAIYHPKKANRETSALLCMCPPTFSFTHPSIFAHISTLSQFFSLYVKECVSLVPWSAPIPPVLQSEMDVLRLTGPQLQPSIITHLHKYKMSQVIPVLAQTYTWVSDWVWGWTELLGNTNQGNNQMNPISCSICFSCGGCVTGPGAAPSTLKLRVMLFILSSHAQTQILAPLSFRLNVSIHLQ